MNCTLCVDVIVLKKFENEDNSWGWKMPLIQRKKDPDKGKWALPGGKVEENETTEEAAIREIKEETGLDIKLTTANNTPILCVGSTPERDPRGRYVSICYLADVEDPTLEAGSDAEEAKWFFLTEVIEMVERGELAFDHGEFVQHRRFLEILGNRVLVDEVINKK